MESQNMLSWEEPTGIIKVLALHRISPMMILSLPQVIRRSALHSWRGSWDTWCHRSPGVQATRALKSPRLKQELNSETKGGATGFLFEILFLMRFNLDNRVMSFKVTLCSHLGLNVLWCARSDECHQTPPAPPMHRAAPAALLQVPLVPAPSWWNQGSLQWEVKEKQFDSICSWWPQWWTLPQGCRASAPGRISESRINFCAVPLCDTV